MAPKSSNKMDNVDVDLEFEQDIDITWVYRDKLLEFHNDFGDSQETSSLNESSRVQLRVKTTYIVPYVEDTIRISKHVFSPETTVYGGTNGVKLLLNKTNGISLWEDSPNKILSMDIQNLYINDKSIIEDSSSRKPTCMVQYIIISDIWQMPVITYTNGCCVPQFIFDTLHNPSEENPRNIIAQ